MSLLTTATENGTVEIPYRARYKATFEGSQPELETALSKLLAALEAQPLDEGDHASARLNPLNSKYELTALLNEELEFLLFIYWADNAPSPIEIFFDLDSPVPIEIPIDELFFEPAKAMFPNLRLVYNALDRPKLTLSNPDKTSDAAANRQWLSDNRQQYKGRWVALRDGQLLAAGTSVQEVVQQIEPAKHILLTAVY